MIKKAYLYVFLMSLFIFPSISQGKESKEIIMEKIKEVAYQIDDARTKVQGYYNKKRVAILDFESKSNIAKEKNFGYLFSGYLTEYIINETKLKVVERKQLKLILEEQKIGSSDLFEQKNSVNIGKLSGAHFLIMGEVFVVDKVVHVTVKMVSTEKGEVVLSKTFPMSKKVALDVSDAYRVDEKGQLFQVSFDLQERFVLGGAWAPIFYKSRNEWNSFTFNMGYQGYVFGDVNRYKHRFKIIDGDISVNPLSFDLLLFEYDMAHVSGSPLLWVTTFIGNPKRIDFFIDLGMSVRLGRVQYHPMRSQNYSNIEIFGIDLSTYIWQSRDMLNYFRFRFGPIAGLLFNHETQKEKYSITGRAALEARFVLDRAGHHNLAINMELAMPYYVNQDKGSSIYGEANMGYEWIVMAVNDSPVSLFLKGGGEYREDIPDINEKYGLKFQVGLNFSFGSPPLVPVMSEKKLRKETALINDDKK